ncbi:hypothetical protein ACQKWADRAFT_213792 [Trichoderma austrokoningii]
MDSTKEPITTPTFVDGGRPIIKKSSNSPKFRPNDQVLFYDSNLKDWTGPFLVSHLKDRQYKLCNEQQQEVNDGQWIEEATIKLFDPFE